MAYQLIYTSIRSGLTAGRSGFCTAARHREIKESLVARLEDLASAYDRGVLGREGALPVLYSYRIIDIRESRYHVLMRAGDAGNDYSGRTNHLAHFLVIEPEELAGLSITPAEAILALQAGGFWSSRYEDSAQYFGEAEVVSLSTLNPSASLPASAWENWTGAPGNAASLYDSDGPQKAGFPTAGDTEESATALLQLYAEGALLKDPTRRDVTALWSVPFTTLLQSSADRRTFAWAGVPAGTPLAEKEEASGRRIFAPGVSVMPPEGRLAMAAAGQEVAPEPTESATPLPGSPGVAEPADEIEAETLRSVNSVDPTPERQLPRADLSGAISDAALTPEIAIPLSSRETDRRKKGSGALKGVLIAAAVVCLLGLVGAVFYQITTKDRRDLESEIKRLVNDGRWEEVIDHLRDEDRELRELPEFRVANTLARLEWLAANPEAFEKIEGGAGSADRALEKLITERGQLIAQHDQLKEARKQTEERVEKWNAFHEDVESLRKNLKTQFDGNIPDSIITVEDIEDLKSQSFDVYGDPEKAAQDWSNTFQALSDAVSLYESFAGLEKIYTDKSAYDAAEKEKEEALKKLESIRDDSPGVIGRLFTRYESLTFEYEPPKGPENVTAEQTEGQEKSKATSANTAENWPVYLVPVTKGNEIDLSNIKETSSGFPNGLRVEPPGKDHIDLTRPIGGKYYIEGQPLITAKDRVIAFEENDLARKLMTNRTRIFPDLAPPYRCEIIIMSGESEQEEAGAQTPLLGDLSVSECVEKNGTAFVIAETAKAQLKRFTAKHAEGNWRMMLKLGGETYSVDEKDDQYDLDPIAELTKSKEGFTMAKEQAEQSSEIAAEAKTTFNVLGEFLFPYYTGKEQHQNLAIVEKDGDFFIEEVKDPKKSSSADFAWMKWTETPSARNYFLFVKNLKERLEDDAADSQRFKTAAGRMDGAFPGDGSGPPSSFISEWAGLASMSSDEGWSSPPDKPASSYPTNDAAKKAIEKYSADLYFSRFFAGWEKIFGDPKTVELLTKYLANPAAYRKAPSLADIDRKITEIDEKLDQLKSEDVLSQVEIFFLYTWREKKANSPDIIQKSFLVLQSKPDEAN